MSKVLSDCTGLPVPSICNLAQGPFNKQARGVMSSDTDDIKSGDGAVRCDPRQN